MKGKKTNVIRELITAKGSAMECECEFVVRNAPSVSVGYFVLFVFDRRRVDTTRHTSMGEAKRGHTAAHPTAVKTFLLPLLLLLFSLGTTRREGKEGGGSMSAAVWVELECSGHWLVGCKVSNRLLLLPPSFLSFFLCNKRRRSACRRADRHVGCFFVVVLFLFNVMKRDGDGDGDDDNGDGDEIDERFGPFFY